MNKIIKITLFILLSIIILVGGVYGTKKVFTQEKVLKKKKIDKKTLNVQSKILKKENNKFVFNTIAQIKSKNIISIQSLSNNKITYVNPKLEVGNSIKENEILIQYDCRNLKIQNETLKEEQNKINENLKLELNNQNKYKDEIELLKDNLTKNEKDILNNIPNINIQKSSLKIIENNINLNNIELENCVIKSPFDGTIISKNDIYKNNIVSKTSEIAKIISDEIELEIPISINNLKYIDKNSNIQFNNNNIKINRIPMYSDNIINTTVFTESFKNENSIVGTKHEVELTGKNFENSYLIKWDWIQKDNNIYYIRDNKLRDLKYNELNILVKTEEGLIIKNEINNLEIITNKIIDALMGNPIKRINKNIKEE